MMCDCINAILRTEKPKQVRKAGFVPGVIYGSGLDKSMPVKFSTKELNLMQKNVYSIKLNVKMGDKQRMCLVKEIQKDSITDKVLHVSLQAVTSDELVKVKIPVVFQGKDELAKKHLVLEILQPEIMVETKPDTLPEFLETDISDKQVDYKVTIADLSPVEGVEIIKGNDDLIAIITSPKNDPVLEEVASDEA